MKHKPPVAAVIVTLILMLSLPVNAQNLRTQLISINHTGTAACMFGAGGPSVSADGRYVAFSSDSQDLVQMDFNNFSDVFVRDRQTSTTTMISIGLTAPSGNGNSIFPVITPGGRYVAFSSDATNLVTTTDTNGAFDAFVRDRQTAATTLISFNSSGTASGNASSGVAAITSDGRHVLFSSTATNLVATSDTNGEFGGDIFVRDRLSGTTTLVTINMSGTATGNGASFAPVISESGRYVAFFSNASDLVSNDTNGFEDVFVRDLQTGTTTLVSVNMAGTASGSNSSEVPKITPDGRYVVFDSFANDLVANDTDNTQDLFRRDLVTGTTTLVSINMSGTSSGDSYSYNPAITPDGRFVAFVSAAGDLVANDTNGDVEDVFVRDMQGGTTSLVSLNGAGTGSANSSSVSPLITPDGRFVAFSSASTNLVAISDTNNFNDVFLRDRQTGRTRLVSINSAGNATGNHYSFLRAITPDGRFVAFEGAASDLVTINDTNNFTDVFLFNATPYAVSDFDGDGKSDVSVFRPSNGGWYLLRSTAGFTGVQFGISTDKIVPADYDGDGKTDIAVYRDGAWYLLRSTLGFTGVAFGVASDIPQPADFDGDGRAELAVFRPSNGTWYVYNLVNNQFSAFQFGAATDKPVVGDYDGDGKADYAVYRDGAWYLQRSQLGFTGVAFGEATDRPVVGDYDGDGKADIALFRPSNGTWYSLQSTAGFTAVQFGLSSDVPSPGDYDGDGKTDIAVFRPSEGAWYELQSTGGFYAVQFGANGDVSVPSAYVP